MEDIRFPQVEYPNDREIEHQIKDIVAAGIERQQALFPYLLTMYARLGFRNLFRDWTEILFMLIVGIAILILFGYGGAEMDKMPPEEIYSVIFISSPLLYLLIAFLFFLRQRHSVTYETEMVCKYNVYQLAAFRMLVFSLVALAVNSGLITLAAGIIKKFNVWFGLSLSAASLFIFAAIFLYVALGVRGDRMKYALLAGWLIGNLALFMKNKFVYMKILAAVPGFVYFVIAVICCVIYVKKLKKLITLQGSEGAV